ncbi:MAG: hypothetical protein J6N52_01920, partial [Clostridia bacterium]|nr:hypothetical protein [Clostridia bacterium]
RGSIHKQFNMIIISCVSEFVKCEEKKMIYSSESISALEACERARLYDDNDTEFENEDNEHNQAVLGLILRRNYHEF